MSPPILLVLLSVVCLFWLFYRLDVWSAYMRSTKDERMNEPPAPPTPPPAQVPFMITKAMIARIKAHGVTDAQIAKMTPAVAWSTLLELDALNRG